MNIFSFFSGAGFLDLGFELSGHYNIVYVNEYHKAFNDVYRYSRKLMGINEPIYGHHIEDVTQFTIKENVDKLNALKKLVEESKAEHITGMIGGPPCPDFSVGGKNRGKDGDNGKLSGTYTELICQTQPDFFLFENVKGLYRTIRHRAFFEELKVKFKNNGYYLTEQLVNAIEFGAPQDRDRIILIGFHRTLIEKKHINVNEETKSIVDFTWDIYKKYSREEAFGIQWPTTNTFSEDQKYPQPKGIIPELTIQYWWNMNDVEHHPNANMFFHPRAGLARFTTIDEGDDKKKSYKRLHRWRYSPTAAYGNNEVHLHPYKARRISVAEALAIQSLPKEFVLPSNITLTDAFKTIGNGVPFLLALGIAKTIYKFLSNGEN